MMRALTFLLALVCGTAQAQTVTPSSFGMNYSFPTTDSSRISPSIVRMWDETVGGAGVHWTDIETARGVYNWTAFDAILAHAQAIGADVTYTFGLVPNWANGATPDVPPTSFTDFYNFVTAVATRAGCKIKYYAPWNEANLSGVGFYWSGTQAQMLLSYEYQSILCTPPLVSRIGQIPA